MFVLWLCLLFTSSKADTYASISLSTTTNNYLTTTVSWGTPAQGPFTVLVDTTSTLSFVLSTDTSSITDNQNTFDSSSSSTFSQTGDTFNYLYEGYSFHDGSVSTDTLTIAGYEISSQDMGLATNNLDIFQNEDVSGILALGLESTVSSNIAKATESDSSTISILFDDKSIKFGEYTYSSINDSVLSLAKSDNKYLKSDWVFTIKSVMIEDFLMFSSNTKVYGVIDTASPYISIYSPTYDDFVTIWKNIDGSSSLTTSNCNETTRVCSDTSIVRSSITITSENNDSDSFYISQSSFLSSDGYLNIKYGGSEYTDDDSYVFFFGGPFLTTRIVQLSISSLTVSSVSSTSEVSSNLLMIIIILSSVVGFAILFFVVYFWRNKLPPSGVPNDVAYEDGGVPQQLGGNIPYDQRQDVEQMRLLRSERFINNMNDGYGGYVVEPPPPDDPPVVTHVVDHSLNRGSMGSGNLNDEIRNRRLEFLQAREIEQQQRDVIGLDED